VGRDRDPEGTVRPVAFAPTRDVMGTWIFIKKRPGAPPDDASVDIISTTVFSGISRKANAAGAFLIIGLRE